MVKFGFQAEILPNGSIYVMFNNVWGRMLLQSHTEWCSHEACTIGLLVYFP